MEFQAIILCGKGRSLSPFSSVRSTGIPKALLPIANTPMLEYVLEWCERAFFPRVTVICDSDSREEIQQALDLYQEKKKKEREQLVEEGMMESMNGTIDQMTVDGEDTGEVLYQIYNSSSFETSSHFVILPCDFITDLPPQVLIEAYRNRESTDLGLFVHYRNNLDLEDKKSLIFPSNYTVYADLPNGSSQLLDLYSKEDVNHHKALSIRSQMCWRYPRATISTKLLNSYIFFGSFQTMRNIFESDEDRFTENYFQNRSLTKIIRDLSRRSWRHSKRLDTVGFSVIPEQATFFRVNRIPVWIEANRYFLKVQAAARGQQSQNASKQKDKASAHVGIDSLVGEDSALGEKTNIKRTVLGTNCIIGKRVKLNGCVILNNVTIEDDVLLENCIVGKSAIIRSKLRLVNCNIESSLEVARNTQSKGETLLCLSLEGIVDDSSVLESDSDFDSEESSENYDEGDYDDYEYGDNSDGLFAY